MERLKCFLFGHDWWLVSASRMDFRIVHFIKTVRRCKRCGKYKTLITRHDNK